MPPRAVAAFAALWTVLAAGLFVSSAARGGLQTTALALAVGGLIGIAWLLGLLILVLFLVAGADKQAATGPTSPEHADQSATPARVGHLLVARTEPTTRNDGGARS